MLQRILAHALAASLFAAVVAHADEASVKKAFLAKFPKATVATVTKLKDLPLYEIVIPRSDEPVIIYTDEAFSFLMQGNVVDNKTGVDITEQKKSKLTAIDFDSLPLDKAIKKVKGNGTRKVAVFTDPDCPFCKRIEQEFEKMTDVTIYLFLFPIEQLHPKAAMRAKSIWCSPNRLKAWEDYMLKGVTPTASGDCDNPIDALVALGQAKGINATPTLVFADGSKVPGALNSAQLEQQLAAVGAR